MSSACNKIHCTCLSIDVSTAYILFRSLQQTYPCISGSLEGRGRGGVGKGEGRGGTMNGSRVIVH